MSYDEYEKTANLICANSKLDIFDKIRKIFELDYDIGYVFLDENTEYFTCPYCHEILIKGEVTENQTVELKLFPDKTFKYNIYTPCCHRAVYTSNIYHGPYYTEKIFYNRLRQQTYEEMQKAKQEYQECKDKYNFICDTMQDKDALANWYI